MSDKKVVERYMKELARRERLVCFDALRPGSRPTVKQEEIFNDIENVLCRYLVAANQTGKTMLGAREAAWLLEGNHPFFDVKAAWGERPLTLLMIGKSTKMMMNEIWDSKIKPLLAEDSYKETIQGNALQWVTHKTTGNKLIFISHNNVNEAREHSQGYVAQWVWLDEMPDSVELFGELITRVISSRGRFLATFTPLIRNLGIKDLIEAATPPTGKKYKLRMFDNPIFEGREEELLAQYAGLSEQERNARLYGDWFLGSSAVYTFSSNMIEKPEGYHPSWRHIECVDPASSGKTGYVLLAEKPSTFQWYVVKAAYIDKDTPNTIVPEIRKLSDGYNVVKRVSDPHEAWFINGARELGLKYHGVFNKNGRLKELISNAQQFLYDGKVKIAPWCEDLISELTSMQYSDSGNGKIVGSQKYHCENSFRYACDHLLAPVKVPVHLDHTARLKYEHRLREAKEDQAKKGTASKGKLVVKRGRIIRRG